MVLPGSFGTTPSETAVPGEAEDIMPLPEDCVEEVDNNMGGDLVLEPCIESVDAGEMCGPDTAGFVDSCVAGVGWLVGIADEVGSVAGEI